MQKISVIVPCFNEEPVLPRLFERMTAAAAGWGREAEFLCVDDGSRDRTWELLRAQHERDPRWRCLSFARNFGHQAAVSAGLHYATGAAAVIIDADLQDPPEEIARLLARWDEGYEVVYARRIKRRRPAAQKDARLGVLPADCPDDAVADAARCRRFLPAGPEGGERHQRHAGA